MTEVQAWHKALDRFAEEHPENQLEKIMLNRRFTDRGYLEELDLIIVHWDNSGTEHVDMMAVTAYA